MSVESLYSPRYQRELHVITTALGRAGAEVADLYHRAAAATYRKDDGSPVTDADLAADRIIRDELARVFPDDAILTEEGADDPARLSHPRCWIVDPIDGTQQFVDRTGNFDCLIALTIDGRPVVVGSIQPTTGLLCIAVEGEGAVSGTLGNLAQVTFAKHPPAPWLIGSSIWFGAPENLGVLDEIAQASDSLVIDHTRIGFTPRLFLAPRTCDAVLGFRLGESQFMAYDWDFAVGDLFIREAGGLLTDLTGARMRYNGARPVAETGLIAATSPEIHEHLLNDTQSALRRRGIRPDLVGDAS